MWNEQPPVRLIRGRQARAGHHPLSPEQAERARRQFDRFLATRVVNTRDDAGCLDELLEIASAAADDSASGELSFAERVEAKLADLTNDFHARYGTTLDEASWQRFLADNS